MAFSRDHVRHPLTVRRLTVSAARRVVPNIVRVTLTGQALDGFASDGPSDHVKVYLPDPGTGILTLPEVDAAGMRRGDPGAVISRDYTPRAFRPHATHPELDLDFVTHGTEGPASSWAEMAKPGDELGIGGPRGSRLAPRDLERLLVIADETALPATARWIELLPDGIPITVLFEVADESVTGYFDADATARLAGTGSSAEWLFRSEGAGQLDGALRSLGRIDDTTYVFLAGEAATLTPLRRYLRRELNLPADQVAASGYWRRGVVNLDHHAPLDPSDPD